MTGEIRVRQTVTILHVWIRIYLLDIIIFPIFSACEKNDNDVTAYLDILVISIA